MIDSIRGGRSVVKRSGEKGREEQNGDENKDIKWCYGNKNGGTK